MAVLTRRSAAATAAFFLGLALRPGALRAAPQIIDYSDPSRLTALWQKPYGVAYDVVTTQRYSLRLVERIPGAVRPPTRHNSVGFSMALDDGEIFHPVHPFGDGISKIAAGDVESWSDLDRVQGRTKLQSASPMRLLVGLVPPLDDDAVSLDEARAWGKAHSKQDYEREKRESKLKPGQHGPGGNVRQILAHVNLGRRTFAAMPLFPMDKGLVGRLSVSLLIMTRARTWKGSLHKELILIPVEGQASLSSPSGVSGTLAEGNVMRLAVRDLSDVTITPTGGRFAALAVLVSD